jgi:large subunit ribosomal protein L3
MSIGLVVEKCGMTRVFTPEGEAVPVTVLKVEETKVTQVKNLEKDGYLAIQVTTGEKKPTHQTKAVLGHFKNANVKPGKGLWEFRVDSQEALDHYKVGDVLSIDAIFSEGQPVDVQGVSKGKGFSGVIKRYNFKTQDATHGNSLAHRAPGSIGQNQTPGRVFKGKKMAGQMGNVTCSVLSQRIIKIDLEKGLILVKGAVPGASGTTAIIRPAVKAKNAGEK